MPEDINTEAQVETTEVEDTNTDATAEEFNPERAMALIQKLRSEAKSTARELKSAHDTLKAHEDAKLTEQEKLVRELETLRAERDTIAREAHLSKATAAIASAATTAGAVRPDAIAKLVDVTAFDGDNATELVSQVREQFPELFSARPGNADAGAGKNAPAPTNINQLLRQAAGRG